VTSSSCKTHRRAGRLTLDAPGLFSLGPVNTTRQLLTVSAELNWEASHHARCYRVTVGETPEVSKLVAQEMVATPSATIPRLPPVRQLYWKVEAISHGGLKLNRGASGVFSTPDILAKDATFASDLSWTRASAGAGNPVRRDRNLKDEGLKINGKPIEKGLWTHAFNDPTPADVVFDVRGKNFAVFKASVGLDDLGEHGSVQFQVFVDGQKKTESPVMRPKQIHELTVDVTGAKEVTLRVLNGGDGHAFDHAVWGFARFLKAGIKDPL